MRTQIPLPAPLRAGIQVCLGSLGGFIETTILGNAHDIVSSSSRYFCIPGEACSSTTRSFQSSLTVFRDLSSPKLLSACQTGLEYHFQIYWPENKPMDQASTALWRLFSGFELRLSRNFIQAQACHWSWTCLLSRWNS